MIHREDGTPQCSSCQRLAPRCGLFWRHAHTLCLCGTPDCKAAMARAAYRFNWQIWAQICRKGHGLTYGEPSYAQICDPWQCMWLRRLLAGRQEGCSVEVDNGSSLCLACLDTVVIDYQDAAPLYQNVGST